MDLVNGKWFGNMDRLVGTQPLLLKMVEKLPTDLISIMFTRRVISGDKIFASWWSVVSWGVRANGGGSGETYETPADVAQSRCVVIDERLTSSNIWR